MPTPKSKASTNPTLFWLSLCLFIACRGGWAWLFTCVQNEIAISAVLHGGDGTGTGRNRAPCPLLVLDLTWLQNTGQFKKTNKQTDPPPSPNPRDSLLHAQQGAEGLLIQNLCVCICFTVKAFAHST